MRNAKNTVFCIGFVALIALAFLAIGASYPPGVTGAGPGIGASGGLGYTNTFFGATNYFTATDTAAHTNGPLQFYRAVGGSNISNLLADVTLGTVSRFQLVASLNPGDQAYGGLIWNTDHDAAGAPGSGVSEIGIAGPKHIALVPGFQQGTSAHLQIGNVSLFGGYAGQGTGYNNWMFMTLQGPVGQATATNFSGAIAFQTAESQGANLTIHDPGMFAYSILTNAPGRWALAFTGDLGNNPSSSPGSELWDPNTARPKMQLELLTGDIQSIKMDAGVSSPTNLMPIANAPDFNFSMQLFVSNNVVQFQACTNVDSTKQLYQRTTVFLTNNLAAGNQKAIIAPINCRTSNVGTGVPFVTNLTRVEIEQYGQKWTNMACYPIF